MTYLECSNLDGNLYNWGACMQDTFFFGDSLVFSMVIFFLFALLIYKMRLPGEYALPVFTGIAIASAFTTGATTFAILSVVGLMFSFIYVVLAIFRKIGIF